MHTGWVWQPAGKYFLGKIPGSLWILAGVLPLVIISIQTRLNAPALTSTSIVRRALLFYSDYQIKNRKT
jgi:hypothetical protein